MYKDIHMDKDFDIFVNGEKAKADDVIEMKTTEVQKKAKKLANKTYREGFGFGYLTGIGVVTVLSIGMHILEKAFDDAETKYLDK